MLKTVIKKAIVYDTRRHVYICWKCAYAGKPPRYVSSKTLASMKVHMRVHKKKPKRKK